jgi:beta-aspartyl-peptidase (threonine type)
MRPDKAVLVIHGGAGVPPKESLTLERKRAFLATLEASLDHGLAVFRAGGSSLDMVEVAVEVMEESPLFNAGKGAVFTHDGKNELDASIMEGKDHRAGAVAGVTTVRNPIKAARAVLENSPHVFLIGAGAEAFAREQGLEIVDPSFFYTEHRWKALQEALRREQAERANAPNPTQSPRPSPWPDGPPDLGTVGAVAMDRDLNLAAATSTGGMTNKWFGRVGDAPMIGVGTYADNESCAVSATGHGEFFIRNVVAYDIAALVKYQGLSVREAAEEVVFRKLRAPDRGEGGVIALDRQGNYAMPYNSPGMFRGCVTQDGQTFVAVYEEPQD